MLANIGGDPKTCKVTSENKFSSLSFLDRLVKQFNVDPLKEHVFSLDIYQEDSIFVAKIKSRVTFEYDEPYEGYNERIDAVVEEAKLTTQNPVINQDTTGFDQMVRDIQPVNSMIF
jgi:hypothetical protein